MAADISSSVDSEVWPDSRSSFLAIRTAETQDEPADDAATETEAEESEAEEEADVAPSVAAWANAWADEADLLVIGDGYSNLRSHWVHEWGELLAGERPVQVHHWGEAADIEFVDPDVLAEGEGPAVTIWSASRAGSTIEAAAERVDLFVDETAADQVDAVLVSLGRDSEDEDVAASLDALLGALEGVDEELPVLVAVGPEGLYDPEVSDAILDWAEGNEDRVAVVDLRSLAPQEASAAEWAAAFQEALGEG